MGDIRHFFNLAIHLNYPSFILKIIPSSTVLNICTSLYAQEYFFGIITTFLLVIFRKVILTYPTMLICKISALLK